MPNSTPMQTAGRAALPTVIAVAVFVCFCPALHNEFVNWDDNFTLTDNPSYRGLSLVHLRWMLTTTLLGHYRPVTWLTYGVDYALWGMNPVGYHLTNILLHAANATLVYAVIEAFLGYAGGTRQADSLPRHAAAAIGALFFAIHPLRVEAVVWATERLEVLCAFFFLLTLLAYLRMARLRGLSPFSAAWHGWLVVSLACFALSLLSKPAGMMLPVVLLLLDRYPLDRIGGTNGTPGDRALSRTAVVVEKLPFLALALAAGAVAAFVAKPVAMIPWSEHGLVQRTMQAAYGLCFYLWKTVVPVRLSPLYLLRLPLNPWAPRFVLPAILVLVITAALFRMRRRAPWALTAWACYVVLLLPVLGFAQNGWQIAADRYTYLASLPWVVLVGAAVYRWGLAWQAQRLSAMARYPIVVCIIGTLAGLGVLTVQQTRVWHDSLTLWNHVLAIEPDNDIAYTNRGSVRRTRGDVDGALADFDTAIRLNSTHAEPYTGRGDGRLARGDIDGALADLDTAIRRGANTPEVYLNRGTALQATGALDAAVADFTSALRLNPQFVDAYYNRGNARRAQGDLAGARTDYDAVLQLNPQHANAYNNRGNARRQAGDLEGAVADYAQAVQLTPVGGKLRAMFERNLAAARREAAVRPAHQP